MQNRIIALIFCLVSFSTYSNAQDKGSKQYQLLEKALKQYQTLNAKGKWPQITYSGRNVLKLKDTAAVIPLIKERLRLLGDLRRVRDGNAFSLPFEEAVKHFQLRHGLEDDGTIGPAFMKALNMPLEKRIEQLTANMNRIKEDTVGTSGTRIIANIPEYKLYVMEDNREVLAMDIVVGKTSNPTVVFSDSLETIVFSPYWNVPASIVKNEILPAMNKNGSYLQRQNMEIIGKEDGLPKIRQKPGPDNALGSVKFLFPNKYNIYFHDTPAKTLFDKQKRAFSHGCIRLSQPYELAQYLLKDKQEWSDTEILRAMGSGSEKWVKLDKKIPVSIIYYTAWVDNSGVLNFRDDIYGHDDRQAGL
ncbi:L,D-transpeptidase family protein [Daejeonella sp.]|uniref:L,D-transpeptidase family protein n=1 Tax=Daejeonella sp. TaxID=2805397 RepID=UPI0030C06723